MTTYLRMPIVFALGVILPVAVVVLILMRRPPQLAASFIG